MKITLMSALESHVVVEESVRTRTMAIVVNALLGLVDNYVKITLMTVLESHAVVEEGVWMEFKTSPVTVILDTLELYVNQVKKIQCY